MAKHYVSVDVNQCVSRGFSDDFEQPDTDSVCINEDGGRHFELFGVINPPLLDGNGVPLYKLSGGIVIGRTAEEIAADILARIPDPPSIAEQLAAAQAALAEIAEELGVPADG